MCRKLCTPFHYYSIYLLHFYVTNSTRRQWEVGHHVMWPFFFFANFFVSRHFVCKFLPPSQFPPLVFGSPTDFFYQHPSMHWMEMGPCMHLPPNQSTTPPHSLVQLSLSHSISNTTFSNGIRCINASEYMCQFEFGLLSAHPKLGSN